MSTAAIAGFNGEIYISVDGGTVYRKVGEAREITINVARDELDATSHDSAGWKESISGNGKWTASCEALYISSDQGQDDVWNSLYSGTTVKWKFIPKNTSGLEKFTGDGVVLSYGLTNPNDDVSTMSLEIGGTGAPTKGAV